MIEAIFACDEFDNWCNFAYCFDLVSPFLLCPQETGINVSLNDGPVGDSFYLFKTLIA